LTIMNDHNTELATLGGGCFWCLEAVFDQVVGVKNVVSGYAGGISKHPSYQEVCSGNTGHAEVVQITFDPLTLSYRDLLEIFFSIHDPTTLNRQGNDIGTQYRSVIFFHNEEQRSIADRVIREIEAKNIWPNPVVTEVVEYTDFYPAEEYHQEYYQHNQYQPYCQVVIAPKLAKFRKQYLNMIKQPAGKPGSR